MIETIVHSLEHALMISTFVLSMMLLIEYFTVQTKNKFLSLISKNPWWQIIIAAFLGIIPGCLGAFFAVSLYSHKVINFPALVTVLIATSGDEAFVMLAEIPKEALLLNLILFVVAIAVGVILTLIMKDKNFTVLENNMLHQHDSPQCVCFDRKQLKNDWKNLSFERSLLLFFTSLILIFIIYTGVKSNTWNFKNITMIITLSSVLFIVATVPEHFLTEHLWKHTIKKHLLKIFLWTSGAILIISIILPYLNITQEAFVPIAENYYFLILFVALAVGIIPESGPNLVFIFLFAQGYIPFSILMANSIVQDGHGSLPLLAESRKSFFYSKGINVFIGLIAGIVGYFVGF
ncbi:MAG: putative manganese transporter [Bacteroidota bacterium]|nr:putative manganese transporter [Bacteroidota bacterium]